MRHKTLMAIVAVSALCEIAWATGRRFGHGTMPRKKEDKSANPVDFKKNVPSPQDWVLVLERVKP